MLYIATIKDIAKETGLALSTISKYLNGGSVRPNNRILLDNAVKKLDFQVNEMARGLRTNKSKMIGIVIPKLSNLFTTTIIEEIENILRQHGYGTMIMNYNSDDSIENDITSFLLARKVDGIVYMPISKKTANLEKIVNQGIPVVLIDRRLTDFVTDFVGVDNVSAGEKAAEHLIKYNHKKIGVIAGPYSLKTTRDRLFGFSKALEKNSIKLHEEQIIKADFNIEDGYKAMSELLRKCKDITAVFATNYEMTIGAIMSINEKNMSIPNDISLVGFDNIELAAVLSPQITIVCQPVKELARQTANVLLDRIAGKGITSQVILDCYIEHGKSVKKLKA